MGRAFNRRKPGGELTYFLRLVTDSLKVRNRLHGGDDEAQISRRRRTGCQNSPALLVNAHFHFVYLPVQVSDAEAQFAVGLLNRLDGAVELFFDQTAHIQYKVMNSRKILVEAAGRVLA